MGLDGRLLLERRVLEHQTLSNISRVIFIVVNTCYKIISKGSYRWMDSFFFLQLQFLKNYAILYSLFHFDYSSLYSFEYASHTFENNTDHSLIFKNFENNIIQLNIYNNDKAQPFQTYFSKINLLKAMYASDSFYPIFLKIRS